MEKLEKVMRPCVAFKGKKLTLKQFEVLELVAQGWTNIEIGSRLRLSPRTVESHIANIRDMVSKVDNEDLRLNDRKLVLFAKEMVDGYKMYMKMLESNAIERLTYSIDSFHQDMVIRFKNGCFFID